MRFLCQTTFFICITSSNSIQTLKDWLLSRRGGFAICMGFRLAVRNWPPKFLEFGVLWFFLFSQINVNLTGNAFVESGRVNM